MFFLVALISIKCLRKTGKVRQMWIFIAKFARNKFLNKVPKYVIICCR